ncbi:transposable element Tc1 transposase [Trichonephila clavipes]|nr:transposable element Tc1 transposase [Trichonephila clavipes]
MVKISVALRFRIPFNDCLAAGFELITSICQSLKGVVSLDWKRQVGQIGESLAIWVEAMRLLEDAGKNGWTVADFNIMLWCLALSGWNHVDWGCIEFNDKSHFQLCPDDHRRRVWRRPWQRSDPTFPIVHHSGPQPEVMYPGLIFQQDNARPHTSRVAMNLRTACQTFPWLARSPDLSPIEHVWDIMGR